MSKMRGLPGNSDHQRVLRTVVGRYSDDPRVRAVIVFGSLGRGDWDDFSDVDLDLVLADEAAFSLNDELARLEFALAASGDPPIVILPKDDEEADLVLASLTGVSLRFHILATTSPNILASMMLLAGDLRAEEIARAGRNNVRPGPALPDLLGQCVRYLVETDRFLRRGRLWLAIDCLERFRNAAMTLSSASLGGTRPMHEFEASATVALQEHLARTLPRFDAASVHMALVQGIAMLTDHLVELAASQIALTDGQRRALEDIAAH